MSQSQTNPWHHEEKTLKHRQTRHICGKKQHNQSKITRDDSQTRKGTNSHNTKLGSNIRLEEQQTMNHRTTTRILGFELYSYIPLSTTILVSN